MPTTRDLFLYLAVGVPFVAGVVAFLVLHPNLSRAAFIFTFFTGFLIVFLVQTYWSERRSVKLWLLISMLLAVHIAGYIAFWPYVERLPTFLYVLTMPVEVMVIATIVYKCLKIL